MSNAKIYNIKNILNRKNLTTSQSRKNIYNKFMSRGDRRYKVV